MVARESIILAAREVIVLILVIGENAVDPLPDHAQHRLSSEGRITAVVERVNKGVMYARTVAVDEPEAEFGQPAPSTDPILEKAIERATTKKAA